MSVGAWTELGVAVSIVVAVATATWIVSRAFGSMKEQIGKLTVKVDASTEATARLFNLWDGRRGVCDKHMATTAVHGMQLAEHDRRLGVIDRKLE